MAKSIIARRNGDDYQARFFWVQLMKLRTNDYIDHVIFESDEDPFIDDVVVHYNESQKAENTGLSYNTDYFQCKYHVTESGSFSSEALIDPKFIQAKESLLHKLYNAYKNTKVLNSNFRIQIVSNWNWHPDDVLASHLHEGQIGETFWTGTERSKLGKTRKILCEHLGIDSIELKDFFYHLHYNLGLNLLRLNELLSSLLKLGSLREIDPRVSMSNYDDLVWKWFSQGINTFSKSQLNELLNEEKLIIKLNQNTKEISIKSFKYFARIPEDSISSQLDLTEYFSGRYIKQEEFWQTLIPCRIVRFLKSQNLEDSSIQTHLYFDCHLSISFFLGYLINPKYRISIIPMYKNSSADYEKWPRPQTNGICDWEVRVNGALTAENIISISISNSIEREVEKYVKTSALAGLPIVNLKPKGGVGQNALLSGDDAWCLCFSLREVLKQLLPINTQKFHLFISAPAVFTFIFGHVLGYEMKNIQLYEYDFDKDKYPNKYFPTIKLPISNGEEYGTEK